MTLRTVKLDQLLMMCHITMLIKISKKAQLIIHYGLKYFNSDHIMFHLSFFGCVGNVQEENNNKYQ